MSRFFDVLSRAGMNPGSREKAPDVVPELQPDAELALFDALDQAASSEGSAASAPVNTGKPEVVKAAAALKVPRNGNYGTRVDFRMDPGVRVWSHAIDHAVLEHYGLLRTQILQKHKDQPFKSLLITSPGPEQGKTVTVLNLALLFAKLPSFKVLVVEGDLRRGSLQRCLGLESAPGLCNLLDGTAQLKDVILKSDATPVDFVLRGYSAMSPAELLHTPHLGAYMKTFTDHYDMVFIDSAPVNMVEDTQVLAAHADAILLVARPFLTSCKELAEASQSLMRHRIIGAVFNGASSVAPYQRYRSYY
jgi:capsular exopolysaccharide synthesis family protein